MTHYEVLQISPNASRDVVEAAWKALMLTHHPDKGGSSRKAARINEAHDVLSDPEKRAKYDLTLNLQKPKPVRMPRQRGNWMENQANRASYPSAYPQAFPETDMDRVIKQAFEAGSRAVVETVVSEIEKNPFFKTILDSMKKKRRAG